MMHGPSILDALSPASPCFPSTTKTPLRVLPVGPRAQCLDLSSIKRPYDNVKLQSDAERRLNRQKRRQGSIFELPPSWSTTLPTEKPTLKIATSTLAVPLWHSHSGTSPSPLSSSSGSTSPTPLTALINLNFALASSSESSDSEHDSPITPASASKENKSTPFSSKSRPRSQRRGPTGERPGLSTRGRKARPPPLALELDQGAVGPVMVKDGSYFSPITAVEIQRSMFSPDTPANILPRGLPYSIPPVETMPSLPNLSVDVDIRMDGMECIPLTPVPAAPTLSPLEAIDSPTFPADTPRGRTATSTSTADAARRKMAKLARTLGEPVPVELVLGTPRSSLDSTSSSSERSSTSPSRCSSPKKRVAMGPLRNLYVPYAGRRSASSSRSSSPVRAPFRPPGLGLGLAGLSVNVSISVEQSVSSPGPMAPTVTRRRFAPKKAEVTEQEVGSVPASPAPFAQIGRRRSRTLASILGEANMRLKEPPTHAMAHRPVMGLGQGAAMRSEEGLVSWVGEWNGDMESVRRGLRALPRA